MNETMTCKGTRTVLGGICGASGGMRPALEGVRSTAARSVVLLAAALFLAAGIVCAAPTCEAVLGDTARFTAEATDYDIARNLSSDNLASCTNSSHSSSWPYMLVLHNTSSSSYAKGKVLRVQYNSRGDYVYKTLSCVWGADKYIYLKCSANPASTKLTKMTVNISSSASSTNWKKTIVTYSANGGSGGPGTVTMTHGGALSTTVPTRTGYTFLGWSTSSTATTASYAAGASFCSGNWLTQTVTLYAVWTASSYTVTYDYNYDSKGTISTVIVTYGSSFMLAAAPTRTGYTFSGWSTSATATTGTYSASATITLPTASDTTLYAIWTPVTYTVNFCAHNSKTTVYASKTCTYGTALDTTSLVSLTGYTLEGWSTSTHTSLTNGSVTYEAEEFLNAASTSSVVYVYACWSANTYTVKFKSYSGSSTYATRTCTYDSAIDTTSIASLTGYTLAGWSASAHTTPANGTATYSASAFENASSVDGATVSVYAVWSANTYYVSFDANGATGSMATQTLSYGTSSSLLACAFTRAGYDFCGWATSADAEEATYADGATVANLTATDGATIVLYAVWEPIRYSIAFDANASDATGEMDPLEDVAYDETCALEACAFTRTGYVFCGWNMAADGSGSSFADGAEVTALSEVDGEVVTLYAVWAPIAYAISFDANDEEATGATDDISCTYDVDVELPSSGFALSGYGFTSWSTTSDGTGECFSAGEAVRNLSTEEGAVVTLFAIWDASAYTISYDANDEAATGSMADEVAYVGATVTLSACAFTLTGFSLSSWNTAADGSGTSLASEETVDALADEAGVTVTLYAQWSAKRMNGSSSTDDDEDGDGETAGYELAPGIVLDADACVGDTVTLPSSDPSPVVGYTLLGWDADGDGKVDYALGGEVTLEEGMYLTPIYTAITYTIAYDAAGGTGAPASQEARYGVSVELATSAPTRSGFAFSGWSLSSGATVADYASGASVVNLADEEGATVTLHAVWKSSSSKKAQSLKVGKASVRRKRAVSLKTLSRKRSVSFSGVTVTGAKTAKRFSVVSVARSGKKISKSASKISVNAKTGRISVRRGVKAGTYRVKIRVRCAQSVSYTSASKTATVKIVVRR